MKVARQPTARKTKKKVPSRRDGAILSVPLRRLRPKYAVAPTNHAVPLGRVVFFRMPGSELPGYLHRVPLGQHDFEHHPYRLSDPRFRLIHIASL